MYTFVCLSLDEDASSHTRGRKGSENTRNTHLTHSPPSPLHALPTKTDGWFEVLEGEIKGQVLLGIPGNGSLCVERSRVLLNQTTIDVAS